MSSVFQWYTDRKGQDYPPSVSSALRLPGVNDDDIEMQHAQKEAEEDHGDEHGLADEEVRDGLADEEVTSG